MIFQWETEDEKLLKSMRIPPKKKLEWLQKMHNFLRKSMTKKQREIFYKLRGAR